jgi:putative hydrolase of the HAD superfamily
VTKSAILFDLGGTLAYYYKQSEFPSILQQAISEVQLFADEKGVTRISKGVVAARVKMEDHESSDYKSRPLEERLIRIFGLENSGLTDKELMEMCTRFMRPIFARGRCYQDTLPAVKELRSRGFKTAIVSNSSWGSPAALWRDEIRRLGLDSHVDSIVIDRDVGWRKPSKRIFEFALHRLGVTSANCLFVGDHPEWDLLGPRSVGIDAVLVDRNGAASSVLEQPIKDLHELVARL